MDKLTKEFQSGEVLKAQDLNSIKDKVNELVEGVNSGSGDTITVDSSLSLSSTNPVENKVITGELNKKVVKENGKGLSTNDYTNEEKQKLSGIPGQVYSKKEVDDKILSSSQGFVFSESEIQVGSFQMSGSAGVIENPVYSKFSILLELPVSSGATKEYTISDDPLGCNLYFAIDSFIASTGETLKSEIFVSMYEIMKVYVDDNYATKVIVKCKETTTLNLNAYLNVRYIKPYSEKIELDITSTSALNADSVAIEIPILKYDKKMLVSLTTDDANASSFCRVWAGVNGRPVSNKFYHANHLDAGDIPDSIVDATLEKTLGYTDGCGNERRFTHGVAIWPYASTNGNNMMDTTNPVDPSANNTYRFMTPYLQWPDMKMMLKYGCSMYYHNIGTEIFGNDKEVGNVIAGLKADCERAIERVGRGIKILARPDGNNVFLTAAAQSPHILMSVAENSPAVDILPFSSPKLFKAVGSRFFPSSSEGNTEQDVVKNNFIAEYAKTKEQRKWFHFCCHTVTLDWVNLLVWFNDNYGKDGSDDIWFTTIDEYYEYDCIRKNTIIRKSVVGNTLHLSIYLPKGQYFYYPDFTLLLSGITQVDGITTDDKVTGLSYIVKDGKLMLNVNTSAKLIELAEEFTTHYEATRQAVWKNDALYIVTQLKENLRQVYLDRLNVSPTAISLTSIVINNDSSSTLIQTVTVAPTYTGVPTYYRIGETSDLSAASWIAYSGGTLQYTLSSGYGMKTIYLQLKNADSESVIRNSTISYEEQSTEIILTGLAITGLINNLRIGDDCQLSVSYTPSNTTQTGVLWDIDNTDVATIDASGLLHIVGNGTANISVTSVHNSSISAIQPVNISSSESSKDVAIISEYPWTEYKQAFVFDETANVYITIANANNNNGCPAGGEPIYSAETGKALPGWYRMYDNEKASYYDIDTLDKWLSAASFNFDLSSLFSTPLSYQYSNKYNAVVYPIIGWRVPNGTYKVSILSSTTQNDHTSTGHIKINKVEQTLPSLSLTNNKTWMEFDNIVVDDGKLAIMMWAEKSKRIGFNAIKIEKMS
ncbi:Ig-like domain-containing protein [uncultured Bacteroides sp.]|jgi:hypothetical protein|uniref:Ig-like domain-containing protein n=1 Tax=uncultured Bacteroides sp. TaxID=162156 RepID=UPI00280AE676|nr:Ig-like domain-containing protein [uncultured Bacteroides sp.]